MCINSVTWKEYDEKSFVSKKESEEYGACNVMFIDNV